MVQVDVFWSFAIGAGFAASASRQLETEEKPFESRSFIYTLLWLSIFFVPSGATLLWGFPAWETMQVGTYDTIPAWLVALFSGTNVTQGILGYWIAYRFIRNGKTYAANLMWVIGYFLMFFILIHGWDGTGYQRFFYCGTSWSGDFTSWVKGTFTLFSPVAWLVSPVAITLAIMGVILMPFLLKWMNMFIVEGKIMEKEGDRVYPVVPLGLLDFQLVAFGGVVGAAIVSSILIHLLGWILGFIVFSLIAYFVFLKENGILYNMFHRNA
ncbi:MAG: hypothetical protein KJ737_12725 [Proteobacteria bacterium]|nr:hypothetical protein [Pseudomonadota bacterium]